MINSYKTKLISKLQLTTDVWRFDFKLTDPQTLEFEAGQYLILKIPDKGQRNYSIASTPKRKNSFQLIIQMIPNGMASTYLSSLSSGDIVDFAGPGGKFVYHESPKDKIFLATGTGVAPIKSMIESRLDDSLGSEAAIEASAVPKLHLFWGIKTGRDVYFLDDFISMSKTYPNFQFTICLSREEEIDSMDSRYFVKGRVNMKLLDFFGIKDIQQASYFQEKLNNFDYYICGGRDVVEMVKQFVFGLGINKENVYFEKF